MSVRVNSLTAIPVLTLTVEHKDTNEVFRRFVKTDGTRAGANAQVLGVSRVKSTKSGEDLPVDVAGVAIVVAGAAIAADAMVMSDAQGRAITHAGNVPRAGRALAAAAAADDHVPVLLGLGA